MNGIEIIARNILIPKSRPQIIRFKTIEFIHFYLNNEIDYMDYCNYKEINQVMVLEKKKEKIKKCLGVAFLKVIEKQRESLKIQ